MVAVATTGCSSGSSPEPSAPCDQRCQDAVALRALRETMRYAYNRYIKTKDAGAQDQPGKPCETYAGSVAIHGIAIPNDEQGSTEVDLTYDFLSCLARRTEARPDLNYNLSLKGTVNEVGSISAVSTSTMALEIRTIGGADGGVDGETDGGVDGETDGGGDGDVDGAVEGGLASTMSFVGTVYDPPIAYSAIGCEVVAVQNGNNVTGTICGRLAGFSF